MSHEPFRNILDRIVCDLLSTAHSASGQQLPGVRWQRYLSSRAYTMCLSRQDAGGPKIPMRYGRVDCATEDLCAADGVLPGRVMSPSVRLFGKELGRDVLFCVSRRAPTLQRVHTCSSGERRRQLQLRRRATHWGVRRASSLMRPLSDRILPVTMCSWCGTVAKCGHLGGRASACGVLPPGLQ